jgi:hypothetical protein
MYDVKVMFSLFPSLNVRNQILDMENHRQNYIPVYVSSGDCGWGSGRKQIFDLMVTSFP